jgi:hypothetical protein
MRHRFDVGPGTSVGDRLAQRVAVVSPIGEQDLPVQQAIEHVGRATAVMRLSCGEFDQDQQAVGIDQRVDFGGQATARTPY